MCPGAVGHARTVECLKKPELTEATVMTSQTIGKGGVWWRDICSEVTQGGSCANLRSPSQEGANLSTNIYHYINAWKSEKAMVMNGNLRRLCQVHTRLVGNSENTIPASILVFVLAPKLLCPHYSERAWGQVHSIRNAMARKKKKKKKHSVFSVNIQIWCILLLNVLAGADTNQCIKKGNIMRRQLNGARKPCVTLICGSPSSTLRRPRTLFNFCYWGLHGVGIHTKNAIKNKICRSRKVSLHFSVPENARKLSLPTKTQMKSAKPWKKTKM